MTQHPEPWQPPEPLLAHPPSIQSLIIDVDPIALVIQCEGLSPLTITAIQVGYAMSEAIAIRLLAGFNKLKGTHYTVADIDQSFIVRGSICPPPRQIGRWRPGD